MVVCKSCGTGIPGDSKFCPKCGSPVEGEAAGRPQDDWCGRDAGRGRQSIWREEYWEKWGSDWAAGWTQWWSWAWSPFWIMVNAVVAGLFIVLLGVLLFLAASGVTPMVTWSNFWAYLLVGVGLLGVIRETAKHHVSGRWFMPGIVPALALIVLGGAGLVAEATGWSAHWWTFIIVAGGLLIILVGFLNYLWMKK